MVTTAVSAVGFAVLGAAGIVLATVLTILIWIMSACLGITKSRAALWTCVAYPWIGLASLYTTWGAAWITLGHVSLPSRDDPKSIAAVVSFLHAVTVLRLISHPLALLSTVVLMFFEAVQVTVSGGTRQGTVIPWLILTPICFWSFALILLNLYVGGVPNWLED